MKQLQLFFHKIVRSCYDVEWYREVRTLTIGAGLRYIALLHLVIALGTTAIIAPAMVSVRNDISNFAHDQLPPDGFLSIADGILTSNFPQPFERKSGDFTFIVDPSYDSAEFPARITGNNPVVMLGKRAAFVQIDATDRRIQANDLKSKGRVTMAEVVSTIDKVPAIVVCFAALIASLFYALVLFGANAVFAWVSGFVLAFLGKKWGAPLARDRWFAVSLFAITLPTIVDAASVFLGIRTSFLFTGIFLLIISAVFIDEKNQPTTPPSTTPITPDSEPASSEELEPTSPTPTPNEEKSEPPAEKHDPDSK